MDKRSMLNDIVKGCEIRFSRGSATDWKHSDFNDLRNEIFNDTGVDISPNTLKRVFGKISVDSDYLPQPATIEALEKYGGIVSKEAEKPFDKPELPVSVSKPNIFKNYKNLIIIAVIFIVLAALVSLIMVRSKNKLSGSIKQTAMEGLLPATVSFDIQAPNGNDSVFVNFGDKSPLVYVKKDQTKMAHIFLLPGVFNATLQTKLDTIASTKVFVQSNKWIGLGFHRQRDLPDHYYEFPALKTGSDSLFHIPNNQLFRLGLDTAGSFFTRLCNFTSTGYTSDNFVFQASFRNDLSDKGIYCHNSTEFRIAGADGGIRFQFVGSGCSSKVINVVSELTLDGMNGKLSQFVIDLGKWNTVKMINQNKHVSLFVNDKLIYTQTYQNPLGEIKGLFIEFEGNGFVKSCNLKTPDGKTLYSF